jgi:hypothetical protein
MADRSTIAVDCETQDRLEQLKPFESTTYDDVIRVLLAEVDTEDVDFVVTTDE